MPGGRIFTTSVQSPSSPLIDAFATPLTAKVSLSQLASLETFHQKVTRTRFVLETVVFSTEDWWDHTAKNNPKMERYPLHIDVLSATNSLTQNPGY